MAKQPDIETIVDGSNQQSFLNKNFKAIRDKFNTLLSRDGATPNAMKTNFNVGDFDLTNVDLIHMQRLTVTNEDVLGLLFGAGRAQALFLSDLSLTNNDLIYYNQGELIPLGVGANGQLIKIASGVPAWGTDIDTDTNTVGVTVQEDGVTVADNVTTINFVTGTGSNDPYLSEDDTGNGPGGGNEVSLNNIDEAIAGDFFLDQTNDSTNLTVNTSLGDYGNVIDLQALGMDLDDVGDYTVKAEFNGRWFNGITGFEHAGNAAMGMRFYDTSDVQITELGLSYGAANDEFRDITYSTSIPGGTRYIRFDPVYGTNTSQFTCLGRERRIYRT